MDRSRYEWVTGPVVLRQPTAREYHAGKGKLETTATRRFLAGQIRDKALGIVVNWAMSAPSAILQARLLAHQYSAELPRADDWMPTSMVPAHKGEIPAGWTFPAAGSEIETGMVV